MNPEEIKRREYLGLAGLVLGLLNLLAGLAGLMFSMPLGLLMLGLGTGLTAAGVFILKRIPDVVSDEPGTVY